MNISKFLVESSRNKITIDINLGWLLFYLYYLYYGYFGSISFSNDYYINKPFLSLSISLLTIISQVLIGIAAHKYSIFFTQRINISWKQIYIFLTLLLIHLTLTWTRLNLSLFGDELLYSQLSHLHAIQAIQILYNNFSFIGSIKAKSLIQTISFLLIISQVLFIYGSSKLPWLYRILIVTSSILIYKLIYAKFGGYLSPHPPLLQLPSLIFGALLGISNFSIRISYLIPYVLFVSIIFFKLKKTLNVFNTFTCVLAISTLPIALNMSTEIENSNWAFYAFTIYLLLDLISLDTNLKFDINLISIFTMFRQTTIFAFIPISLKAINKKNNISWTVDTFIYLIPMILFLNFFIFTTINGSAAIESIELIKPIDKINAIKEVFTTNIIYENINQSLDFWWTAFFPFSFIRKNSSKKYRINISWLIFFLSLVLVFHLIKPDLWGSTKYQLEYFVPFCITGFIRFIFILIDLFKKESRILIGIISVALIVANMSSHKSFIYRHHSLLKNEEFNKSYVQTISNGFASIPYPFDQAYEFIKKNNYGGKTYIAGPTYGIFTDIINNLSINEVISSLNIIKEYESGEPISYADIKLLTKNRELKVILVPSSVANQNEILKFPGWLSKAKFHDNRYSTSITIFTRDP